MVPEAVLWSGLGHYPIFKSDGLDFNSSSGDAETMSTCQPGCRAIAIFGHFWTLLAIIGPLLAIIDHYWLPGGRAIANILSLRCSCSCSCSCPIFLRSKSRGRSRSRKTIRNILVFILINFLILFASSYIFPSSYHFPSLSSSFVSLSNMQE